MNHYAKRETELPLWKRVASWLGLLFLLVLMVFCFWAPAHAQERSNTYYVSQFYGSDVGAKTTNAQSACSSNASLPCIIVFDAILAAWPTGTLPAKCANCTWVDYSGQVGFAGFMGALSRGWCITDLEPGGDAGAQINSCLLKIASGIANGMYSGSGGTITTQVSINNLSHFTWQCNAADAGWASGNFLNGITGNPAEPAIKITGTSTYVTIEGCSLVGNGQTGASGNGNGFAVIGTGATPAEIKFENVNVSFHKGNGKDGTGASIPAAGIYSYQSIDIFINRASLQANQHAIFADLNSNNFYVTGSVINGNLTDGVLAHTLTTLIVGANDIEAQAGYGVVVDTVTQGSVVNNHYEGNTGCLTVNGAIGFTTGLVFAKNYCANSGNNASVIFSIGAVNPKVRDNVFAWTGAVTAGIGVDVSDGVVVPTIIGNQFYVITGGTVSFPIILRGTTTGSIAPIVDGNQFGRTQANVDGTLTRMMEITNPTKNARVTNNSGYANSGSVISNGIVIDAGSVNTFSAGNTVTSAGTGSVPANAVIDNGTNTFFGQKITGTVTTAGTAVAAGTCQAQTGITLTGATIADAAMVSLNLAAPATWQTGIQWQNPEVTANTCTIRLCNPTAASITPAATAVRCTIIR